MLNDIRSAVKNSIIYGFGNLSTKLVGLVLLPLYTKYLTVADYGALGILEVSAQIITGIFGFGLYQAFFRWYWDKRYVNNQSSLFFTSFLFLVITSIVVAVLFYFFSGQLSNILFESEEFRFVIRLLIVSACFDIIIQVPNSLIRLQEKPVLFSVANVVKLTVSLSLTVIFITRLHLKLEGIYIAQICGQVVFMLTLIPFILKNLRLKFEYRILKEMIRYSLPLALSAVSAIALSISDRYILKFLGSLNEVGLYSLGYKMANTIYVFVVISVNLAVTPMIFKKMDEPDHKRFYSKLMTYYVLGILFCAMGMSFFGKEVIKVLAYNKAFFDAYKVIPIISFSIVFMVMRDTALIGLIKLQKSKTIALAVFIAAVTNILFDFIFIHFFEKMGAAIATLCSQIFYFTLVYFIAQRYYKIPYEMGKILKMFIVAIFLTIIALLTNNSLLFLRLFLKSLLLLVFPIILYFLNFYETIELENLKGFWLKWRNPLKWKETILKWLAG